MRIDDGPARSEEAARPYDSSAAWWWCGLWAVFMSLLGLLVLGVVAVIAIWLFDAVFLLVLVPAGLLIIIGGVVGVVDLGRRWSAGDPGAPRTLAVIWALFGILPMYVATASFAAGHPAIGAGALTPGLGHWLMAGWAAVSAKRLGDGEVGR